MKFLSQQITELTSSTVEDDWADWSSSTTYNVGTEPLSNTTVARYGNYYYRTIVDGNIANDANDTPDKNLGTKWIRWAVSNKHAMIDLQATTRSIIETPSDYITNGSAQIVNLTPAIVVVYQQTSSDGGDGTLTDSYQSKLTRSSIDLNQEDFLNTTNWELLIDDLIVTFPKGQIDSLAIGYYTAKRVMVEVLDGAGTTIWSESVTQSVNEYVFDYYDYFYETYSYDYDRSRLFGLPRIGETIRVTFEKDIGSETASCGFLVGSEAVDMGDTLYGVDFKFNSYSIKETDEFGVINIQKRGIQELIDFETVIESVTLPITRRKIKAIYDEIVVFVLDESPESRYDNIVTLGTIQDVSTVLANPVQTTVAYSIAEVI